MIVFAIENQMEIGIFKLRRNIFIQVSATVPYFFFFYIYIYLLHAPLQSVILHAVPYVCGGKILNYPLAYLILNSHALSPVDRGHG